MARRRQEEASGGGGAPAWMNTYGDLVTLLLCFFILLFSMSSVDVSKFKLAVSSFANNIDIMPGGIALSGGELITNGISQLEEINIILDKKELNFDEINEEDVESEKDNEFDKSQNGGNFNSKTEQIAKEIKEYLAKEGIDKEIIISYNSNYVKMTIEGEVLFDIGKAELKQEARPIINSISNMILEKNYKKYGIQIDGHTDNWDINTVQFPSNWYLSAARAIAVGDILIKQYNFNPDSIACTGYGEFNPIADNETPEGRAKNRRVEIKLIVETEEIIQDDIFLNNN